MNQETITQERNDIETVAQIDEVVLVADEQDENEEERNRYYEFFRH